MKLRYTSLQVDAGAAEEHAPRRPGRPRRHAGGGRAAVHSQVAAVVAAAIDARPGTRIAYVMTDGAALPARLSDLVAAMVERGLLDATVTAGHAFGGDLEAVNVPSALALARHVFARRRRSWWAWARAWSAPASPLGTTALEVAGVLDAAAALGGQPVACLRMSDGDHRDRHRGVSHHTRTALDLVRSSVSGSPPPPIWARSAPAPRRASRSTAPDVPALLAAQGLHVTTMGRSARRRTPLFFRAAGRGRRPGAPRCSTRSRLERAMATEKVDKLERLLNLTPCCSTPCGRSRADEIREQARLPGGPRRVPPGLRAGQGRPAGRWASRSRRAGPRGRPARGRRLPHPPRRVLPAATRASDRRAGGAAPRGVGGAGGGAHRRPRPC